MKRLARACRLAALLLALSLGILETWPASADGLYFIDPGGAGAFEVYCDMARGGWTQVLDQDVSVGDGYLLAAEWLAGVTTTPPNGGQQYAAGFGLVLQARAFDELGQIRALGSSGCRNCPLRVQIAQVDGAVGAHIDWNLV